MSPWVLCPSLAHRGHSVPAPGGAGLALTVSPDEQDKLNPDSCLPPRRLLSDGSSVCSTAIISPAMYYQLASPPAPWSMAFRCREREAECWPKGGQARSEIPAGRIPDSAAHWADQGSECRQMEGFPWSQRWGECGSETCGRHR